MSVSKGKYKKITTNSLQAMKLNGEKISMLTAYDYTLAKIVDSAGIDIILVGDSRLVYTLGKAEDLHLIPLSLKSEAKLKKYFGNYSR